MRASIWNKLMPVRDTGRLATSCPVRDPDGTIVLEARGPSRRTSSMYGKTSVSQLLPKVSCRSRTTQRPTCSDGVKKQNSKTKEPLERTATETKHTQLFVPLHCNLENDIVKACGYASSVASINQTDNATTKIRASTFVFHTREQERQIEEV